MEGLIAQQPSGLIGWVSQYGQVVFFFAQLAYWLMLVILIGYAVAQFKRWVNYQLGTGKSGALRQAETTKQSVSVEEFVD